MTDKFSVEFTKGVLTSIPMLLAFIPIGLIFGAQASMQGMSFITAFLMTAMNFAGGSEFAAISIWSSIPPFFLIAFSTFFINSRHVVMSAALCPYLKGQRPLFVALIYFLMCDESFALNIANCQKTGRFSLGFYLGSAFALWANWWCSSMIGALIGHGLGDLSAFGVAMAFPAIFIFLTVAMWPKHDLKKEIAVIVSLLGAAFAAQIVPVVYCTAIGSIIGILVFCLLSLHKEKV